MRGWVPRRSMSWESHFTIARVRESVQYGNTGNSDNGQPRRSVQCFLFALRNENFYYGDLKTMNFKKFLEIFDKISENIKKLTPMKKKNR